MTCFNIGYTTSNHKNDIAYYKPDHNSNKRLNSPVTEKLTHNQNPVGRVNNTASNHKIENDMKHIPHQTPKKGIS